MAELKLDCNWIGSNGKARVTVKVGGEVIDCDTVNLIQQKDRERFIKNLTKDRSGIDADDLREQLIKLAAAHTISEDDEENKSVTDLLIELVEDAELFHDSDRRGYATIKAGKHYETYPIRSKQFRLWLRGRLWSEHQKTAYSEALQVAIENIETMAIYDGPETRVHVRLAEHDGATWLDLADENWRAVRISPDGWQVHQDKIPAKFIRPKGMQALPEPVKGGSVELLRKFLNLRGDDGDDGDYVLLVSWIMACLNPSGPYPILTVSGEQGSAKSSACRILRNLIDPNAASLRAAPREERDLVIAAGNSWILIFDNLSRLAPWLSDALCRISTGGGFGTRQLHTDQDEILFDAKRPIAMNGITDIATRADILDRSLGVMFAAIPEDKRRAESKLWSEFDKARPLILGALLDAVATGLKNYDGIKLDRLPRMADFARWVSACESGLGWSAGTFMAAYDRNRSAANVLAIESHIIGPVLMVFMENRERWAGTYGQLLSELDQIASDKIKRLDGWPKSARNLSNHLRRITPNLRAEGIEIISQGHTQKGSSLVLENRGKSQSSPSPQSPGDDGEHGDGELQVFSKPDDLNFDDLSAEEREIFDGQVRLCLEKPDIYTEVKSRQDAEDYALGVIREIRGGAA
jgi:hypothetical protein